MILINYFAKMLVVFTNIIVRSALDPYSDRFWPFIIQIQYMYHTVFSVYLPLVEALFQYFGPIMQKALSPAQEDDLGTFKYSL